ncbi:hypothetical protein EJB05_55895 [Eragrostis curvula]|uniref:Uncharacterized protein n=1 Tax=Eragrostis curvula TaxID=38414 RepID=A0A5J9SI62_9POAL|nr:hypothetical protein EJB05_55895 [Eragrostis curvula]
MAALYMSTTKKTHLIAISMFLTILYCTLLSITYAEEQDELRCEKVKYYRLDECRRHCARVFAKDFTYFLRVTGGDFECCCKRNLSFPPPQPPPGPSGDVEIIAAADDGIHA